ncbi:unnamed protein product [Adineta ricciae]|uniref:Uncharacterized protein n=1 Tax=Adineta ricciae TaxID=249248 RepID=A0A814Q4I2_ADIRI|nr:unnamed protein product [Adineta ricciae]CAF1561359.1 unnamed protein product [Adineta ricciae]
MNANRTSVDDCLTMINFDRKKMNENNDNDNERNEFPFGGLFRPVEKIFADFDRFFAGLPPVFSIPSQEFSNESSQRP